MIDFNITLLMYTHGYSTEQAGKRGGKIQEKRRKRRFMFHIRTEAYRERNGLSGQSQSPDLSLIENLWLKKKDKPLVTLHVLKLVCGTLVVVTLSASNTEGGDTCQSIHTI